MNEQCPKCLSERIGKNNYGKKPLVSSARLPAFMAAMRLPLQALEPARWLVLWQARSVASAVQ